jgi:phosphofructokinase-like protein
MKLGILTSGGDCSGLNAVIRAAARRAERGIDAELIGFDDGWLGVMDAKYEAMTVERCRGLLPRGGTTLGTSRTTPYQVDGGLDAARATVESLNLDGIIVIGGNGSLANAHDLTNDGIPCVGVPKTIDNDVAGTDFSVGFDTAVHVASAAIDRLHTTAEAHDRVLVVELMGRHAGHIALRAGMAGGAAMSLIPEVEFDIAQICDAIQRRHEIGRWATIIAVAEGAQPKKGTMPTPEYDTDEFGHEVLGGIASRIAPEIQRRTGFETRVTILGHVQRGGTPTAFDRVLGTRLGVAAVEACADGAWGTMVGVRADDIVRVPLDEVAGKDNLVTDEMYRTASYFFP